MPMLIATFTCANVGLIELTKIASTNSNLRIVVPPRNGLTSFHCTTLSPRMSEVRRRDAQTGVGHSPKNRSDKTRDDRKARHDAGFAIDSGAIIRGSVVASLILSMAFQPEIDMSAAQSDTTGPDLALGIAVDTIADGTMLAGHIGDDAVLLARSGNEFFAVGATCTHYGGPLAEGVLVDHTVRCPWHHACFDLRSGEALHAPALSSVACWSTEVRDNKVFVRAKVTRAPDIRVVLAHDAPRKIVIIGGGAAGFAAAEMLRRQRFDGDLVMLSDDDAPPVDRPNLSKDYLAGNAPENGYPCVATSSTPNRISTCA
jgi:nitrite reductase/ring-hydroxylating ferredoxin subunit